MACQRFSDKPASPAVLPAATIVPTTDTLGVDRRTTAGQIAQAATAYNAALQYITGTYVWHEGAVYRAAQNSLGQTPSVNINAWKPALILADTTVSVPSQVPSISGALKYLSEAVIAADVTIQVADGTYNLGAGQLDLNHPFGGRISLIGNTTTPANVTLTFGAIPFPPTFPYLNPDSGSIYVNSGCTFGLIDGFTITGPTGNTSVFGHCAILAFNGNITLGPNLAITGFYFCVAADSNGSIVGQGTSSTSMSVLPDVGNGQSGIYASSAQVDIEYLRILGTGYGATLNDGAIVRLFAVDTADGMDIVFSIRNAANLSVNGATIGDANVFYSIVGQATIDEATATYGTSDDGDLDLAGSVQFRSSLVFSPGGYVDFDAVQIGAVQVISGGDTRMLLDIGTLASQNSAIDISVDGNVGVSVGLTGAVETPVSLAVGTTALFTGIEAGRGTLDGTGLLVVPATWVTANTVIVPIHASASFLTYSITPGVSFTISSDAGGVDTGVATSWIALVYP